ncbi:MAG: hypothetical protein JXR56_03510 [Candidatus Cloacimonetes bacterium]|nr:hypothetical protein [Candidatus Cloacimonadota bacterium]
MKKALILLGLALLMFMASGCKKEDVYYSDNNLETIFYVEGQSNSQYPGEDVAIYLVKYDPEMTLPETELKKFGRKKRDYHPGKRVNVYYFANEIPNKERYEELGKKEKLTGMELKHFITLIDQEDRYSLSFQVDSAGKEEFIINN